MKNIFANLLLVLLLVFAFVACDNAEESYVVEGTSLNIYDVKAGANDYFLSFVPVFADTAYTIKANEAGGLVPGDRVYAVLKHEFDAYAMQKPQVSFLEHITKVRRSPMSKKGSFDAELYNSPFSAVDNLFSFSDFSRNFLYYECLWTDGETQNVAVRYDKGLNCSAVMTVEGLRDGVLYFRLYANIADREWVDNETFSYNELPNKACKILSFNMDWDMIYDELSEAERKEIVAIDSLRSNISLVVNGCKKDENGLYEPQSAPTNINVPKKKFANKLYNRK